MGCCCSSEHPQDGNQGFANNHILAKERDAISLLLHYLDNRDEVDFFNNGPLDALTTLANSKNIELQRSAALAFAEITEKCIREVSRDTLRPILFLLESSDVEVQRAASAALGNLAVNSNNKKLIVEMGGLRPLIRLMQSDNVEVQCNAVGCMTNLATHEENKSIIARSGALYPLAELARSKDMRVQRNATGALLNMTHSDENRQELVKAGAIPVLVSLLESMDPDVQYYCTTTLSNIAVDPENRKKLAEDQPMLVNHLVKLMGPENSPRVQCQAALALRNLASDSGYQIEVVQAKGLPYLRALIESTPVPLVLAAVACIRNVSINKANERFIVNEGFLPPLVHLLDVSENEEVLCHATSTLRNLAASSEQNRVEIAEAGAIEKIRARILNVPPTVQSEMTACLAVIALGDAPKNALFEKGILDVLIVLTHSTNVEIQGNSAAAIGNLSNKASSYNAFVDHWLAPSGGIRGFLITFLKSDETMFQHIATWMILQLLESDDKRLRKLLMESDEIVKSIKKLTQKEPTVENPSADSSTPANGSNSTNGSTDGNKKEETTSTSTTPAKEEAGSGAAAADSNQMISQRAVPQLARKAYAILTEKEKDKRSSR